VTAEIEASPLAVAIRASAWTYPALEALHIAGIATLFGSLLLLDVRVFGAARAIPVPWLARLATRVSLAGFALAAASGALMWSTDAAALSANPAFRTKLALITLAGLNAVLFNARHGAEKADAIARLQAGASLALWLGAIGAGRWIAYV
jgi:hypothetical protein